MLHATCYKVKNYQRLYGYAWAVVYSAFKISRADLYSPLFGLLFIHIYYPRDGCFSDHMPWGYDGLFEGVGLDSDQADLASLDIFLNSAQPEGAISSPDSET